MSQFNKNSERHLKHKILNHEFDFAEHAWEDMEQLLDQDTTAGPVSDYGNFTGFVSFSKIIKLIVPGIILFSIIGWITINTDNIPSQEITPETEETVPTKEEESIPEEESNIPYASNQLKLKETFSTKITSESTYNSVQEKNDTDLTTKGKQKEYISKAVVYTNSASFSVAAKETTDKKKSLLLPNDKESEQLLTALRKPSTTKKIKSLDLAAIDFNEHTSIAEFIQEDTSIFYTGNFNLEKLNFKPRSMNWGLAVGASLGNIDWSRFKFSVSPQAGIFVSYQLNEKYALQAELLVKNRATYNINNSLIESKNTNTGVENFVNNYSIKSLWFVELPLMVKKKLNAENLNVLLGLRPSYIVHQTGDWSEQPEGIETKTKEAGLPADVREGMAVFDVGFLLGLEYQLNQQISLQLRYAQGFTDFTKNDWFVDNDLHLNSDLQLAMLYQF